MASEGLVGRGQRQQGRVGASPEIIRSLAEEADPVPDRRQAELLQRPGQRRLVIQTGQQRLADPGRGGELERRLGQVVGVVVAVDWASCRCGPGGRAGPAASGSRRSRSSSFAVLVLMIPANYRGA